MTANLDNDTETSIIEVLKEFKGRCTCIIATHRPKSLENADKIYDLQKNDFLKSNVAA
jgi:ABC-type bacteriocin/lantibiotic exporter with double-glycine peptidase domain